MAGGKNNYINEALKQMRYAVFYKGECIRKYPFYKQGRDFCIKNNMQVAHLPIAEFAEEKCELIDRATGEILNYLFE